MIHTIPSNEEKTAMWKAYHDRRPTRVPVTYSCNPRVVILNPKYNVGNWDFVREAHDPKTHVDIALHHQLYIREVLSKCSDFPAGIPDVWEIGMSVYNVYEAAYFGAKVDYQPDQVPCTEAFLSSEDREKIFEVDIENVFENPFVKRWMKFWKEMDAICKDYRFMGRPVKLTPWTLCGTDGQVTAGCNVFGSQFIEDLIGDPEFANRFMDFVTRAAINRRRAFWKYWGDQIGRHNGMADDSVAMLSTPMYTELVMPFHRRIYDTFDADNGSNKLMRCMHLCGDATRHFPTITRELNVQNYDTGFPVDHGALRKALGPDVEIAGGPEVAILMSGTPEQVFERTRHILLSGVKVGGRFTLKEANNLPPNVPEANLEAMYEACLEFGRYE